MTVIWSPPDRNNLVLLPGAIAAWNCNSIALSLPSLFFPQAFVASRRLARALRGLSGNRH
jgi:hypothetical protein